MSLIEEELKWDLIIIRLDCELSHLVNALLPLPLKEIEFLESDGMILPFCIKKQLSWKARNDLEKSLEHLPVEIFFSPAHNLSLQFAFLYYQKFKRELFCELGSASNPEKNLKTKANWKKMEQFCYHRDFQEDYNEDLYLHELKEFLKQSSEISEKHLYQFLTLVQKTFNRAFSEAVKKPILFKPLRIQQINENRKIGLKDLEYYANVFGEHQQSLEFMLILPCNLSRILYGKLLNWTPTIIRQKLMEELPITMHGEISDFIFSCLNNWILLKEPESPLNISFQKNSENLLLQDEEKFFNVPTFQTPGFLVEWKVSLPFSPVHSVYMLFSDDLLLGMLQKSNSAT